ncbi:ChaN family lipoprotein [Halomonas alkaliantarctica]|uniref:ChaN family lipoprotein n=1 Tax=Halomonas alkaliantarctica TaxID=232346 RepID=A0ABY8LMM4_9GAMM|nr:ChaN family lipoprotein [Halomonas alkaliantarctica]WGI25676.1 ChaN family lipoprotein [Halomonas alkaliantarctica]
MKRHNNCHRHRYGLLAVLALVNLLPSVALAACPSPGQWWQEEQPLASSDLLPTVAQQQVVLLGEQHDEIAHHRWQLHTLAGLHALRDDLVIGLEMLPRSAQPTLDAWLAGELDTDAMLEQTQWDEAWGFDSALYMPILEFARMANIPLVALNIAPDLRQRLVNDGWEHVPADERHAMQPPQPASVSYRSRLTEVFNQHAMGDDPEALERFIQAQLTWDTAMAQRLAEATQGGALAVGLIGLGHVTYNEGIAYQLKAFGVNDTVSLLPWEMSDCTLPDPTLADVIYILADE